MHTYVSGDDGSGSVHKWWRDVSWGVTNPQSRLPCLNIHRGIDRRSKFFGTVSTPFLGMHHSLRRTRPTTVLYPSPISYDEIVCGTCSLTPLLYFEIISFCFWFALWDRRSWVHVGIICLDFQYTNIHSGSISYCRKKTKHWQTAKSRKLTLIHQLFVSFSVQNPNHRHHTPAKKRSCLSVTPSYSVTFQNWFPYYSSL